METQDESSPERYEIGAIRLGPHNKAVAITALPIEWGNRYPSMLNSATQAVEALKNLFDIPTQQ